VQLETYFACFVVFEHRNIIGKSYFQNTKENLHINSFIIILHNLRLCLDVLCGNPEVLHPLIIELLYANKNVSISSSVCNVFTMCNK
jgi:hypothetical protein